MDLTCNAPSIDQISFKLTQNFIPSVTLLPQPPQSLGSLDYTLSRVSIQYILGQNYEPNIPQTTPQQSCLYKESTLKTTCAELSGLTSFKKNKKPSFRQRLLSSSKSNDNSKIKRRFSLHIMSFGKPIVQKKDNLTPLHSPHPAPFRSKQQKKKSAASKKLLNNKKLMQYQLLELQNSMKVQGLVLQTDQTREKSFMRKIIQNRSNTMHPIEQISCAPPIWTSRRSFRIH